MLAYVLRSESARILCLCSMVASSRGKIPWPAPQLPAIYK